MNTPLQFNIVDIIVLAIILLGAVRGLLKGLSGMLADVISVLVALAAGWYFFETVGDFIVEHTRLTGSAAYTVSFAAVVLGAYALMRVLRLVLRSILEFSFKGRIERGGGALAGFIHATVLVAAVLLFLSLWPHEAVHQIVAEESVAGRFVAERLGPFYDSLAERYPVLRFPREREESPEEVDLDAETDVEPEPEAEAEPEAEQWGGRWEVKEE